MILLKIEVRDESKNVLKVIDRVPFISGGITNFIPYWIRYQKQEYLLQGGIDCAYLQGVPDINYIVI